jgi:hypothetical protein
MLSDCIEACHNALVVLEFVMLPPELLSGTDKRKTAYNEAVAYGIDIHQLEYLLTLTPMERLMRHDDALAVVLAVREAGIQHYGFDPRHPEAP